MIVHTSTQVSSLRKKPPRISSRRSRAKSSSASAAAPHASSAFLFSSSSAAKSSAVRKNRNQKPAPGRLFFSFTGTLLCVYIDTGIVSEIARFVKMRALARGGRA